MLDLGFSETLQASLSWEQVEQALLLLNSAENVVWPGWKAK